MNADVNNVFDVAESESANTSHETAVVNSLLVEITIVTELPFVEEVQGSPEALLILEVAKAKRRKLASVWI